jgi:hypothetical protein
MTALETYRTVLDTQSKLDVSIYEALVKRDNQQENIDFGNLYSAINKTDAWEVLVYDIISTNNKSKIELLRTILDRTSVKKVALLAALSEIIEVLAIGDLYQGGTIFYLDGTGKHGLIVANEDAFTSVPWGSNTNVPGSTDTAIGTGLSNTLAIIANPTIQTNFPTGLFAAYKARNYTKDGYSDWYLPSKDELNLVYTNLKLQGLGVWDDDGSGSNYWSSTSSEDFAWVQLFYDYSSYPAGAQGVNYQTTLAPNRTRAIRSF